MKTAIVTDSTADLPENLLQTYQIHSIPATLVINGQSFVDGDEISRDEFYQQLPTMETPPSTATPSSGVFQETYQNIFQQGYDHIISIHPPARLSGLFNAARLATNNFRSRVTVIDSGTVTLSMGFQAISAAEAAMKNLPLSEILTTLENVRKRIHLLAMLDSLEYVRRSGRVSWATASVGTLLQLKPFLTLKDGHVLRLGQARTRHKGIEHLYESLRRLGSLERLAILHTNALDDAQKMMQEFAAQVKSTPFIVNVTTVIGTHVGPNGLGFVAVVE